MDETEALLAEGVERLFSEQLSTNHIVRAEQGEWQESLWNTLEIQGLTRALAAEDVGGSALGWSAAHVLVLASGRHAAPVPLPETLLASWLLRCAQLKCPTGPLTVAQAEAGQLKKQGSKWSISETLYAVPWANACEQLVLCTEWNGVPHVGLLTLETAHIDIQLNIAREPRCNIRFDEPTFVALTPVPELPPKTVLLFGALIRSAQIAGAAERILDLSIRYAQERVQFGRPLAKFQAIQQHIAVLGSESAAMSAAARYAFLQADTDTTQLAIMAAKIRTSLASGQVTALAHAIHGAIGFTYEHPLHFLSRRLWSWRSEFGNHALWSRQLGRLAITAEQKLGWWQMVTSIEPNADRLLR